MKKIVNYFQRLFGCLFPRLAVKLIFLRKFRRLPNLRNPKDLNEKIQWLKFHGDMRVWADLADKYLVREYVKSKGLEDILVPLLGKFDTVDALAAAWDSLKPPFVIKTNNACKEVIIVKDKAASNPVKICIQLRKWLSDRSFWGFFVEPHYRFIKPCIVVERYLEEIGSGAVVSSSLIDYKIWCFDGRPYCVFVTFNRQPDSVAIGCYDTDWNQMEDSCVFSGHFRKGPLLPRPESLDKMLEYASVLSAGFSQVRVDLYNTDGQIRFGEMTFTSNGGFMTYFSSDSLKKMGDLCHAGALPGQTSVK